MDKYPMEYVNLSEEQTEKVQEMEEEFNERFGTNYVFLIAKTEKP